MDVKIDIYSIITIYTSINTGIAYFRSINKSIAIFACWKIFFNCINSYKYLLNILLSITVIKYILFYDIS